MFVPVKKQPQAYKNYTIDAYIVKHPEFLIMWSGLVVEYPTKQPINDPSNVVSNIVVEGAVGVEYYSRPVKCRPISL